MKAMTESIQVMCKHKVPFDRICIGDSISSVFRVIYISSIQPSCWWVGILHFDTAISKI